MVSNVNITPGTLMQAGVFFENNCITTSVFVFNAWIGGNAYSYLAYCGDLSNFYIHSGGGAINELCCRVIGFGELN